MVLLCHRNNSVCEHARLCARSPCEYWQEQYGTWETSGLETTVWELLCWGVGVLCVFLPSMLMCCSA